MEQHSTLAQNSALPAVEGDMPGNSAARSATASVSAGIAAANAHLPESLEAEPHFPGEDGGRSLAEMAHRDLEAALQLLAERAQYITGASGAAIALRRGEHNDMLCRASAGSNAPELGALLSMEYGLSGESVRTRQALRCDDTERDPRVNREGCRQLGIASVVVMPIVSEQQVLGVFELFSGKPRAFEERDLSALQRLSEMVETAVRHAVAAQSIAVIGETAGAESQASGDGMAAEAVPVEAAGNGIGADMAPLAIEKDALGLEREKAEPEKAVPEKTEPGKTVLEKTELEKAEPEPVLKNPLFWSADMRTPASAGASENVAESISISVPVELRDLQKCKACGFPVSRGRTFCVECEEKQWRGERLPRVGVSAGPTEPARQPRESQVIPATSAVPEISSLKDSASSGTSGSQLSEAQSSDTSPDPVPGGLAVAAPVVQESPQGVAQITPGNVPASDDSTLFLSSAAPSQSWLAANKYVLGALLVVAIVIGAIAWLR
jgi:hypothetical protein